MGKIEFIREPYGTIVTFEGNQVAFEDGPGVMLITDSDEDFENDEFSEEEIEAIIAAMPQIEEAILAAGFKVERRGENMMDDEWDKQQKLEIARRDLHTSIEGLVMVYLNKLVDRDIAENDGKVWRSMDAISADALKMATDMADEIDRVVKEKLPG